MVACKAMRSPAVWPGAWLTALALLLVVSGPVLAMATGTGFDVGREVHIWAIAIAFAATGVLIAANHPGTGSAGSSSEPRFLQASDCWPERTLSTGWTAGRGQRRSERRRRGTASSPGCLFILVPTTFLLLLFPDGRLLSPRWRPVASVRRVGHRRELRCGGSAPWADSGLPFDQKPPRRRNLLAGGAGGNCGPRGPSGDARVGAVALLRFRRAGGEQRQQIKWLAFAGAVAALTVTIAIAVYDVVGEDGANQAIMLSVLGLPAATGVAILRHRLYDIDVVISRTIVYAASRWARSRLRRGLFVAGCCAGCGLDAADRRSDAGCGARFPPVSLAPAGSGGQALQPLATRVYDRSSATCPTSARAARLPRPPAR